VPFYEIAAINKFVVNSEAPPGTRTFAQITSILLPNGKVLINFLGATNCYILEPNEYGSYRGGKIRRIADIPQTNTWGSTFILNSGKVLFTCGEFAVSAATKACQLFDPVTESWTILGDNGLLGHMPVYMTTGGDFYGLDGYHAKNSNMTPSERNNYYVHTSPGNPVVPSNPNLSNTGEFYQSEIVYALSPSGYYLGMPSLSGDEQLMVIIRPGVPSANNLVWNSASIANKLLNVNNNWWRMGVSPLKSQAYTDAWRGNIAAPGLRFEPGCLTYMAKINKFVLISGNGALYTIDYSSQVNSITGGIINTISKAVELPNVSVNNKNTPSGTISSESGGKTAIQIVGGGELIVDISNFPIQNDPYFIYQDGYCYLFIRILNNSRWVKLKATAKTVISSTKLKFTGVDYGDDIYNPFVGDINSVISTGDAVSIYRPSPDCRDENASFLPNGDLICAIGLTSNKENYWNVSGPSIILKWDGQNQVEILDEGKFFTSANLGPMFPLPDGSIFINRGTDSAGTNGVGVYVPTTSEAVPLSNSVPTITSAPASVFSGSSFTLTGNTLNGIHEGGYQSEDMSCRTNFPIVRLTDSSSGYVYYCATSDFTYRGIEPGVSSSCKVFIPPTVPLGTYNMQVVANGVPSANRQISISGGTIGGEAMMMNRMF